MGIISRQIIKQQESLLTRHHLVFKGMARRPTATTLSFAAAWEPVALGSLVESSQQLQWLNCGWLCEWSHLQLASNWDPPSHSPLTKWGGPARAAIERGMALGQQGATRLSLHVNHPIKFWEANSCPMIIWAKSLWA